MRDLEQEEGIYMPVNHGVLGILSSPSLHMLHVPFYGLFPLNNLLLISRAELWLRCVIDSVYSFSHILRMERIWFVSDDCCCFLRVPWESSTPPSPPYTVL